MVIPKNNDGTDNWLEYRRLVLHELERGSTERKVLSDQIDSVEARVKEMINAKHLNPEAVSIESEETAITFKWLVEKALLPILLSVGMLILGYIMANVVGVGG